MSRVKTAPSRPRRRIERPDTESELLEAFRAGTSKPGERSEWSVAFPESEAIPVRLAVSPMHTVVASIFEVLAGQPRGAPASWLRYVRTRARRVDLEPLRAYYADIRYADFLCPDPASARATFAEQIELIRATPPEQVQQEMTKTLREARAERRATGSPVTAGVPEAFRPYFQQPARAVAGVCDALEAYWQHVFAPLWGKIESLLERELLILGHALATEGYTAMLGRTSPRLAIDDAGVLHWNSLLHKNASFRFNAKRLLLLPMLCGPDGLFWGATDDRALIAYAAPRTNMLWDAADESTGDALVKVMGSTRARIMLAVQTPTTTSDVADQLGLSTSLVSHHLLELQRLGLVDGARFGRRVYYRLASKGIRLRAALADD